MTDHAQEQKKDQKEREIKVPSATSLPSPSPESTAVTRTSDQKIGSSLSFFTTQAHIILLQDYLDTPDRVALRDTTKSLQSMFNEDDFFRKLLQEEIGPDPIQLVKKEEKTKDAYLRHRRFLRDEFIHLIPVDGEGGRFIIWLDGLQQILPHYPQYHPEAVIYNLLRLPCYKNQLNGAIRHFNKDKDKFIKRIIRDKKAFINQFNKGRYLTNFLINFPQHQKSIINNLSQSEIFISLINDINDLKFFYHLPKKLTDQVLTNVMNDPAILNHLFKNSRDLLFFAITFPAHAKRLIEKILADKSLLSRLINNESDLECLIFPSYIEAAKQILAQPPESPAAASLTVSDKKKDKPEQHADDALFMNPLASEEIDYRQKLRTEVGPDLTKLISPRQTAQAAYEYHRKLIEKNFETDLPFHPSAWCIQFASLIELRYSHYHPFVIYQALTGLIFLSHDLKTLVNDFPEYGFPVLECVLADAEAFDQIYNHISDLTNFFNFDVNCTLPENRRMFDRIMHHLLTHEHVFIRLVKTSADLLALFDKFHDYRDVLAHYVLTNKNIFNQIFKDSSDTNAVIRNYFSFRRNYRYFFNDSSRYLSCDYFIRDFIEELLNRILEDETIFNRLLRNSDELRNLIMVLGTRDLNLTYLVTQVVKHILAKPAIFDRFFNNNSDLSILNEYRLRTVLGMEPFALIVKYVLENPSIFIRLFKNESDLECLRMISEEYFNQGSALLLATTATRTFDPTLFAHARGSLEAKKEAKRLALPQGASSADQSLDDEEESHDAMHGPVDPQPARPRDRNPGGR